MSAIEPLNVCPACGASAGTVRGGIYIHCVGCGTIRVPSRRSYVYDDRYPADRAHADAVVAHCKQVTLRTWLRRLAAPVAGLNVLEVGFGGGATLSLIQQQGGIAWGLEPVAANRAAAVARGVAPDRVTADLQAFAGRSFDVVLYLDSFEHLTDPRAHLAAIGEVTRPGAQALVVLPAGDSLSRVLLGKFWPHDLDDHWVFYSKSGLVGLWRDFGWCYAAHFFPWKYISARTVARHWEMKTGIALPHSRLVDLGFWLNFGEYGLIFQRC